MLKRLMKGNAGEMVSRMTLEIAARANTITFLTFE